MRDLYSLNLKKLAGLERMAEKSARNVIDALEKSKSQSLDRLIAALGIRHVGGQNAEILAQHFGTMRKYYLSIKMN